MPGGTGVSTLACGPAAASEGEGGAAGTTGADVGGADVLAAGCGNCGEAGAALLVAVTIGWLPSAAGSARVT